MEELIRQAFLHVEGLGPHVLEGHYDLIGPKGDIILPRVWETIIQPGWDISMHMWPMPEPPKPPPPPSQHRFRDSKHPYFPPTPAPSRPGSNFSRGGGPPTGGDPGEPSVIVNLRGGPPGPPPSSSWPPTIRGSGPYDTDSSYQKQDRTSSEKEKKTSEKEKKPTEKDNKERQSKKSNEDGDTESSVSDEGDSAMKIISKFMRVRKVFKVGRMGHGNNRETYFQVSPKKDGLLLLNEYGRKLVDEARKHEL